MICFCFCFSVGEYARTCIGDSCEEANDTNESCDVFVWGSNSSHQLADSTPDKILAPKLTHAFSSVQQVGYFICICMILLVTYGKSLC